MRPFRTAFPRRFLDGYQAGVMGYTYKGVRCLKSPIDMAITLFALGALRPRTIIEIGSQAGGGALLLADMAAMHGLQAHVYSIDLSPPDGIARDDITFLQGDVTDLAPVFAAAGLDAAPHPWFVSEDSAHTHRGCLAALGFFADRLQPGEILAMEDGVLTDLGKAADYRGGPNRAIREFLTDRPGIYEIDTALCDMFGRNATYNPNGYLRRV